MLPGDSRNLTLTGFMGTGKTAVGQEIARRLGREFLDMDAYIEARQGMSVAEIFEQRGEAHFRRLESALCRELSTRQALVIATGGGALIPDESYEILSASGPVICLSAPPDQILHRLEAAQDRPLLDVPDRRARTAALLASRADAYGRIPLQMDTTGLTVDQVADQVLAIAATPAAKIIPVPHPGGEYAIHLGHGVLAQTGSLLRDLDITNQVTLVTNPTVGALYSALVTESLEEAGFQVAACTVPDGEAYKTLDTAGSLYDRFIEAGLDRQGAVLALGGGVIGDMAGFAAATYLRGVPFVQLPTTLLAMVDSSVGGKTAVDHTRGKNLIGAFKQPEIVIADPGTLSTLPPWETAVGLAEAVKTGLIDDPTLFEQIEVYGPGPLPWIVERCMKVKVAVVREDPFEGGRRAVLNLGHTFGHAFELLSNFGLSHGEGVGIGLATAARLSARLGLCDSSLVSRVEQVLQRLALPTRFHGHTPEEILQAMGTDKKRRGNRLRFILLRDVGDVLVTDQVAEDDVLATLQEVGEH